MNSKKLIIAFTFTTLLILSFLFGFMSYRNQNFAYGLIAKVYYFFELQKPNLNKQGYQEIKTYLENHEFINYQKLYAKEIYDSIKENPVSFREEILKKAILPKKIVTIKIVGLNDNHKLQELIPKNVFKSLDNKFLISTKYYGIKHFGILEKENNKKLFIFNDGHGESKNPLEYKKFIKLKQELKNNGFDILSLSMSGYGYNVFQDKNMSFPVNQNSNIYSNSLNKSFDYPVFGKKRFSHFIYQHFFDDNYPEKYPISLMLSGNYYIIKKIENNYDEIVMAGLSGGGWQTTMISSLLPKIKHSYSFAGSLPNAYRSLESIPHPVESNNSKFWYEYDFWHFYFLSLFDEKGFQNREHNLIYGAMDKTAFYPPYSPSFSRVADMVSADGLNVFILEKNDHNIDVEFLKEKIIN